MLKSCRKYLVVGIASLFFLSASAYAQQATTVGIDVKPQSCPNPLNAKKKGVIPVAILGSDTLDVGDIDPSTIQLNGVDAKPGFVVADVAQPVDDPNQKGENLDETCGRCWEWDDATEGETYIEAGGDGHLDLVLTFDAQAVITSLGPLVNDACHTLELTGELTGGGDIEGTDFIRLLVRGGGRP